LWSSVIIHNIKSFGEDKSQRIPRNRNIPKIVPTMTETSQKDAESADNATAASAEATVPAENKVDALPPEEDAIEAELLEAEKPSKILVLENLEY
jgi:hypothetical protein